MPLGDISTNLFRIEAILESSLIPVPSVFTYNESGFDIPIAYDIEGLISNIRKFV